jgi:Arylsulfatase regulator (Fe-S oxidoreductase)
MDINDGHEFLMIGDSVVYCNPIVKKALSDEAIKSDSSLDNNTTTHAYKMAGFYKQYGFKTIDNKTKFVKINPIEIEKNLANLPQITFEVTDACNLKCKYCGYGEFYDDYDERTCSMLDAKKAILLLNYLIDKWNSPMNTSHGREIFVSFYGGEPLLNMNFIMQIIEYLDHSTLLHNKCRYSMTTNGILLDKYLPLLVEHNVNLLISLDGDDEGHSYRVDHSGKNSFERVLKNIKHIQKKYPKYFETNVNFNAVLHNRNSVKSIYQFIKDEFGKTPNISELNNTGIKREKQDEFFDTYRNISESLYQAEDYSRIKKDMFLKLGEIRDIGLFLFKHSGNFFQTYNDFFANANSIQKTPTGTCKPFGKKLFVTVNGKILPCERVGHQYALGHIDENGVQINFEKIAHTYNQYFDKLSKQCNCCHNADACMQCVFQLNDLERKPVCLGFTNQSTFRDEINYKMHYLAAHKGMYSKLIRELVIQD